MILVANESFSYFGSILSYLIVALPIFAGAFADKDPSEMSEIISKVIHTSLWHPGRTCTYSMIL